MPTSKHFWIVAMLSASFVSSVVTPAIGRLDQEGVKKRARDLLPGVIDHLVSKQ